MTETTHTPDQHEHEHPGPGEYIKIALILAVVTAIEVGAYYVKSLSPRTLSVALLVMMAVKFSLVRMIHKNKIHGQKSEVVELVGLYWHFVDIIWIVIFTIIYLIP